MVKNYVLVLTSFFLWAIMAFLLIFLAQYNQPNIVDEFCFSWVGKDFGIVKGAYLYYTNWSGRYFTNLLFHLNPLVFSPNFKWFVLAPIFLIFIGFWNGFWFIKNAFSFSIHSPYLWLTAFLFQALGWYLIPGIYQVFYWYPALFYYLSFHLVLLFLNLKFFIPPFKGKVLLYFFLMWAIIGTSEITMLYFSAVLLVYFIHLLIEGKFRKGHLLFYIFWIICVGIVVFAPGNSVRAGQGVKNWPSIFNNSFYFTSQNLSHFFSKPLLYLWFFCLIAMSQDLLLPPLKKIKNWQFVLLFIAFFSSYYVGFLALSIGLNEPALPLRVLSLVEYFLLLFTSFMVLYLAQNIRLNIEYFRSKNVLIVLLFVMLVFVKKNENFTLLYQEFKNEQVEKYALENAKRFDKIKASSDSIVAVEPIKAKGSMFFVEELSPDSTHLWCKCIAQYYHKKAVYLKK